MKFILCSLLALFIAFQSNGQLIINEICYDPSDTLLTGDTNGDGVYSQTQDEFIEFVNSGSSPLNVTKYKIYDYVIASGLKTLRHTMGNITLPAGAALVVFGGGTAIGTFGQAAVEVDAGTTGLSMGNTGEKVIIADSSGNTLITFNTDSLSNNPNESYTNKHDAAGDTVVQHHIACRGKLFSPGTKACGAAFSPYLGTAPQVMQTAFTLYPNPGTGVFRVTGTNAAAQELRVYNSTGKLVFTALQVSETLDLSSLPDGIYCAALYNPAGGRGLSSKIVIAR